MAWLNYYFDPRPKVVSLGLINLNTTHAADETPAFRIAFTVSPSSENTSAPLATNCVKIAIMNAFSADCRIFLSSTMLILLSIVLNKSIY
jgi:hypothetical protein